MYTTIYSSFYKSMRVLGLWGLGVSTQHVFIREMNNVHITCYNVYYVLYTIAYTCVINL
jgi:hypothetical protein